MAVILLETIGINTGGPSLESGYIYFDTDANAGQGGITYTGPVPGGGGPFEIQNRIFHEPDGEYPQSPIYTQAGYRAEVFQDLNNPPFATIQSDPVVCDLQIISINVVHATAGNNGQITISAQGSNGTKRYSKNDGLTFQNSNQFKNLAPGSYQIVVSDAADFCTVSDEVTILNEAPPIDDLTIQSTSVTHETAVDANDGKISVIATGNSKPFTYKLYLLGTTKVLKSQNGSQFSDLAPAAYYVEVVDSKGFIRTKNNIIVKEFEGDAPPPVIEPRQIIRTVRVQYVPKSEQYENPFFVKFLNRYAGYTWWLFEKKQTYEIEAEELGQYVVPYKNLSLLTGINFATFYQGAEIVKIGARVTTAQARGLSQIVTSPEICHITPDGTRKGKEVRLLPVTRSLRIYETDRVYSDFEVELSYPKLFLQ